jgi:hypothetical protein
VPIFEVTSLGEAGGGGCTGQNGAEVNVAFTGMSALLLAPRSRGYPDTHPPMPQDDRR